MLLIINNEWESDSRVCKRPRNTTESEAESRETEEEKNKENLIVCICFFFYLNINAFVGKITQDENL